MEWIHEPSAWIALLTLTFLEVVLGIDNIVFLSILTGRLPPERRSAARRVGLLLAMGMRVALLFSISWVMGLQSELFRVLGQPFAGRDLILLGGGLFLMWKSVTEIHHKLEGAGAGDRGGAAGPVATFGGVLAQIALLDLVFSLDSVITAVGMVRHLAVMVIAVLVSVGVMLVFVNPICSFVERHPTVKMLALSFLLLIGFTLTSEAFHVAIPHGYIYFAMAFSVGVEFLNLRLRKAGQPVSLHASEPPGAAGR
ncbi:MAG: TerC family protein [Planctomycetes bacterium]|nr:TerC family protein [Planctomycetota bacterium]